MIPCIDGSRAERIRVFAWPAWPASESRARTALRGILWVASSRVLSPYCVRMCSPFSCAGTGYFIWTSHVTGACTHRVSRRRRKSPKTAAFACVARQSKASDIPLAAVFVCTYQPWYVHTNFAKPCVALQAGTRTRPRCSSRPRWRRRRGRTSATPRTTARRSARSPRTSYTSTAHTYT